MQEMHSTQNYMYVESLVMPRMMLGYTELALPGCFYVFNREE